MKRFIFLSLILTGIVVFSAAQVPDGNFRQEGIASWYGKEFAGKPTANGEIFNPDLFTAAHPSLPFGTILIVTNTQNSKQVAVRVNDRGPFVAARIIDLSSAAAEVLDMLKTGTAPVIIERAQDVALGPVASSQTPVTTAPVVALPAPVAAAPVATAPAPVATAPVAEPVMPPAEPPADSFITMNTPQYQAPPVTENVPQYNNPPVNNPPDSPLSQTYYPAPAARILGSMPPEDSAKFYRLQIGAFKVPRNAVDVFDRLKKAGLDPAYEQSGEFYRVILARLRANEIQMIAQTLGDAGFQEAIIREEIDS